MTMRIASILLLSALALSARAQPAYPTVGKEAQKARDADRRLILETELQAERAELEKARDAFDTGAPGEREATVHRHLENVKALQRELGSKATPPDTGPVRAVLKATRAAASNGAPGRFWDPYQRTPDAADSGTAPNSPTAPRRDIP